jgi:DNA-binding response OmpR family regulator
VLRDGSYELVVTDLGMPQLDGLALARWIGMNRPGVPVIAVSGIIADLQRMQGPSPFAAALQKPLRKRELLAAIDAALGGRFA